MRSDTRISVVPVSSKPLLPVSAPEGRRCHGLSFWRGKARVLFRVLLAVGFVVQSVKFVELYVQYPSTVELEVVQPSELEMPAFTVCNINEIRTSHFCERYPDKCGTPDSYPGFCTRFPAYCKLINDTRRVPLGSQEMYRELSRREQQELGHRYEDMVERCTVETDDEEVDCTSRPLLVPALSFTYEVPFNCYMLYSLHGKPLEQPEKVPVSTKVHLNLNLEVSEYHPDHLSRGAQLSIHSPYHVPSPVSEGLFLNMGTVYRIYVRLAEKVLLPYPYKSNCTDYEAQWRAGGGSGPVTEKMCKEKCKLDMSLAEYGCVERRVDYAHNETICLRAYPNFTKTARPVCSKMCSSPCKIRRYEVQVQEANSEGTRVCHPSAHHIREPGDNYFHLHPEVRANRDPQLHRRLRWTVAGHLLAHRLRLPGDTPFPVRALCEEKVPRREGLRRQRGKGDASSSSSLRRH